jgi:hypothetical protein
VSVACATELSKNEKNAFQGLREDRGSRRRRSFFFVTPAISGRGPGEEKKNLTPARGLARAHREHREGVRRMKNLTPGAKRASRHRGAEKKGVMHFCAETGAKVSVACATELSKNEKNGRMPSRV